MGEQRTDERVTLILRNQVQLARALESICVVLSSRCDSEACRSVTDQISAEPSQETVNTKFSEHVTPEKCERMVWNTVQALNYLTDVLADNAGSITGREMRWMVLAIGHLADVLGDAGHLWEVEGE